MFIKPESRKRAQGLSDLLDYSALVDDGVLLMESGTFLAAWELRGPDLAAYSFHEAHALCARIARRLHLGSGWTIQCDQMRAPVQEYAPKTEWPDPVSRVIDEERRAQFLRTDELAHYQSSYYFCVSYQPPRSSKTEDWIFRDETGEEGQAERDLRHFIARVADIHHALCANLLREKHTEVRQLLSVKQGHRTHDDLCRYVRYCIGGDDFPFAVPPDPTFLNYLLAAGEFLPGATPMLGGKHVRTIAVDSFPEASYAGIFHELDALGFSFRFTQQAQCMSEQEAKDLHLTSGRKWSLVKVRFLRSLFNKNAVMPVTEEDKFATRMEVEAADAKSEAEHGQEHFVRYNAKVVLMDENPAAIRRQTEAVETVLKHAGFGCRIETINASAAWLGSLPGHAWRDRRVSVANTTNLAHMMPLSAPFRGVEHNPSRYMPPNTAPLLYASTIGRTPFRLHLHVGDMGHTALIGPAGAGKTTAQLLIASQWLRYPKARVFAFDKERTAYTLTKAVNGNHYDLGADGGLRFCPLQYLDTTEDLAWATSYIEFLCDQNGLQITPEMRNSISRAILLLSDDHGTRGLTEFQMLVDSPEVQDALQYYTSASSAGGILDGKHETLSTNHWSCFELGALYNADKKIASGVLYHLFHRIWKSLDPSVPTLVAVDEFKHALEHPLAVKNFYNFGIEGRKLNMALLISIQEPGKLINSPLKDVISREFRTQIFLPNASVKGEREAYEFFGVTALDMAYIADAQPCQDYYYTSPEGKCMINLEAGEVALSFLAGSGQRDREMLDRMIAQNPQRWRSEWLRYKRVPEWAEYLESTSIAKEAVAAYA